MSGWRKSSPKYCAFLLLLVGAQVFAADHRPNVVLILADDLGFTDIAPYGSEINTPSLSALAAEGISFSNFHTAASCAPSRAMLLTGVDHHRAGVPSIPEAIPPEQASHENYQGVLSRNVVTVATLLEGNGYHTYMAGKWHLGKAPGELPSQRGFERTVAMMDTGADNWEQKPYLPIYKKANWYADGREVELPDDFYSSRYLVDRMIEFIDSNREDGDPFFAYLPFQAVHIPVQAPREFTDRYEGVYDIGWEVLRERRAASAKLAGLVPMDAPMVSMSTTATWDQQSDEEKRYQARQMAVYAGMVEAMDFHIGRLIAYLKEAGLYENTVFIFTSDNGSEATGTNNPEGRLSRLALATQGYTNDYESLGEKGSYNAIGPSFASASAAPLAFYKFYAGEGGMRVPLIIAGESLAPGGTISHAFSWVTDITPTILSLTGTAPAGDRFGGRPVENIIGRNLLPLIRGEVDRVYGEDDAVGYEVGGNAALFQGDYKIVLNRGPVGDNRWHLYNIVSDPGETSDLSDAMPGRLRDMLAAYDDYVEKNGVLPVPDNYSQVRQTFVNGLRDVYGRDILLFVSAVLTLVVFFVLARRRD